MDSRETEQGFMRRTVHVNVIVIYTACVETIVHASSVHVADYATNPSTTTASLIMRILISFSNKPLFRKPQAHSTPLDSPITQLNLDQTVM